MSISAYYMPTEGDSVTQLAQHEIQEYAKQKTGLLWVDISEMSVEEGGMLSTEFGLHYLSIEDALEKALYAPKIQKFGDVYFMITHGIDYASQSDLIATAELDIWIGQHFVITSHHVNLLSIDAIKGHILSNPEPMSRGPQFLSYTILDECEMLQTNLRNRRFEAQVQILSREY